MNLSSEDVLRLNVLLASNIDAIRIDENNMVVYGLQGESEAKLQLSPNCRHDHYLRSVRELLSGHVLGSPGGYPVYLKRWTRMGQARDESLADLLKLGEPEAVMAVVCAPGLTDEIARRAWWVAPEAEHARRMLERAAVVEGSMGRVLAEYLLDYLPFEEDPYAIVRSVRLMLQPGLIDEQAQQKIWDKGRSKNVYRIGFLQALPDQLPDPQPARADAEAYLPQLRGLMQEGNPIAALLAKILNSEGQTFVQVSDAILRKPANQEVVSALFDAIGAFYAPAWPDAPRLQDIEALQARAAARIAAPDAMLAAVLQAVPDMAAELSALLVLAQVTEAITIPIFSKTDAVGTVMRKRLVPVTGPLFAQHEILRGAAGG